MVTINAVNFIDGLDGLAAGIVAIAACSFLVYSYRLAHVVGIHSQSVPAVVSALLAGMCLGFLPYNFYPARIFMGDTGAMLIGLLLAYVPLSSTAMLDPNVLRNYSHTVNRYPTVLPLLLPAAILVIPYADLLLAVVRRTKAGMSPFAADKKHLHHRLLKIGHSHRQSVLIMYLWAALFAGGVVSLSLVRTDLIVLVAVTLAAVLALLAVTMPRLRPNRLRNGGRRNGGTGAHAELAASGTRAAGRRLRPAAPPGPAPSASIPTGPAMAAVPTGPDPHDPAAGAPRPYGPAASPPFPTGPARPAASVDPAMAAAPTGPIPRSPGTSGPPPEPPR